MIVHDPHHDREAETRPAVDSCSRVVRAGKAFEDADAIILGVRRGSLGRREAVVMFTGNPVFVLVAVR